MTLTFRVNDFLRNNTIARFIVLAPLYTVVIVISPLETPPGTGQDGQLTHVSRTTCQ